MFFQSSMPRINSILATTDFNTARRRGEPRDQTKCEKIGYPLTFSSHSTFNRYFRENGRYKIL